MKTEAEGGLAELAAAARDACGRDWPVAAAIAAEARARFPRSVAGYQVGIVAARQTRRFDEARALAAEAARRFPARAWPIREAVLTAVADDARLDALRLAGELRARFPANPAGYRLEAWVLEELRRFDDALAVLDAAARRFPRQTWPAGQAARLARTRSERAKGVELWEALDGLPAGAAAWTSPPRAVVVVLGMHRAGTSACMRILASLGVSLGGPLLPAHYDNPDGFQEHATILDVHTRLLGSAGADWDTSHLVRPLPEGFSHGPAAAEAVDRLKPLVAGEMAAGGAFWGFKDPRTARFIPLWERVFEALDVEPIWVLAVRDPRAVAASLLARNGIEPAFGALLWLEHYLEALRHLGPRIACVVHYERWFSAPAPQMSKLAAAIGAPEAALERAVLAIRADLRHAVPAADDDALGLAGELHARLMDDGADLARLGRDAGAIWRALRALARDKANAPA